MALANVTLNNTFDEWRNITNQVIHFVNEIETQQLINAVSNTTALTVSARNIKRNDTLYFTLNVSNSVLDRSTINVATANAVNIVFAALANTDARLVLVSNDANVINSVANAAFIQANTARVHANASFDQANTARVHANVSFDQANTARVHANVSFEQANTARTHANTAYASANAGLLQADTARDHANTAHASANAGQLQANTARVHANLAFGHANAAFAVANSANNLSVANTLSNGMTQIRSTRNILNFIPTGTIVTIVEDDAAGNRINVSSQVIGIGNIGDTSNLAFLQANAGFLQANTARVHANASFDQANTARIHANVSFEQANTSRVHANSAFEKANSAYTLANSVSGGQAPILEANKAAFDNANAAYEQANTARVHANTAHASANAGQLQANTARIHANAAFSAANSALSNTSGASFVGNLQIPTGNLTIGDGTTQGIRLSVNAWIGVANVIPLAEFMNGTQSIQLNANTSVGAWSDLMLDRDASIIYSRGATDDGANLVIGPWTDSSFGYKQDGAGRHGFNTSNPRHVLDANGTANISGSLLVGAMNVVPTIQVTFGQANTARDHANAAFLAANTGLGIGSAFLQANTARDHANTAHASANAGLLQANTARVHANVSFEQANTARNQANDAYTRANTGVTVIQTDAISATRYIIFTDKTTGTLANANVATALSYNPSSGSLVATSLKSSALYDSSDRQLLIKDSTGTVVWGN